MFMSTHGDWQERAIVSAKCIILHLVTKQNFTSLSPATLAQPTAAFTQLLQTTACQPMLHAAAAIAAVTLGGN